MIREVILDFETTGLDPNKDRVVSFAAVELEDMIPTGRFMADFVNPGIPSNPHALAVHGLTEEFLSNMLSFCTFAPVLADFIGESDLVIHNAEFDRRFLRAEYDRAGITPVIKTKCTLGMARARFGWKPQPWGGNKLDHLIARFNLQDLRALTGKHGALVDSLLLVNVYRSLCGLGVYPIDLQAFGLGGIDETNGSAGGRGTDQAAQAEGPSVSTSAG